MMVEGEKDHSSVINISYCLSPATIVLLLLIFLLMDVTRIEEGAVFLSLPVNPNKLFSPAVFESFR